MKKRNRHILVLFGGLFLLNLVGPSCQDYLDVVPDNIPTIDHAFATRQESKGFLYGIYSFLPNHFNYANNPSFLGGDEAWLFDQINTSFNIDLWHIARGMQGTQSPLANYWGSEQNSHSLNGGKPLFTAIRDCNIFLENIYKTVDLPNWEQAKWVGEVKFLKAYFHFWLLRMYGPIPIIDKNIPMYTDTREVQMHREPVDAVFDFIVGLLDEASESLPMQAVNITQHLGRITRPIALALKGQVLTYSASPLFNGNPDYANFVDNRGLNLFPQTYDGSKWEKAAKALKEAIEVSHEAGHALFDFSIITSLVHEQTILSMNVRGAFTERWNSEQIWADPNTSNVPQRLSFPAFTAFNMAGSNLRLSYAPTLQVVKQFYTKNGVPIEEDKDWVDLDLYGLRSGDEPHKYVIKEGFKTINLHFNREPRFYGTISFDGGLLYGNGRIDDTDMKTMILKYAAVDRFKIDRHSATGYLLKKNIHRLTSMEDDSGSASYYLYPFPVIRLADLYLMYAETLNEYKEGPDIEVYEYIDLVRNRSGLKGVIDSWANHSILPGKPLSKEGMRDIIRRERLNELAFEGTRFWDLRRWKLLEDHMNRPIRGLNKYGANAEDFYKEIELYKPTFETKDYLWPIRQGDLLKNRNLVQNPGW